jgi:hypothetical protein
VPVIVERTLRGCPRLLPWQRRVEVTVHWYHPGRPELDGFVRYRRRRRPGDCDTLPDSGMWIDWFPATTDDGFSPTAGPLVSRG